MAKAVVRKPKQKRSQQTLDRVVAAARLLLDDRSFDDMSIEALSQEADASVGSIYGRFSNKRALLSHLDGQCADEVDQFIDARSQDDGPLEGVVKEVTGFLVGFYRRNRGILRALDLASRGGTARTSLAESETRERVDRVQKLVAKHRGEIAHPSPEHAVSLGFLMVQGVLRERILFGRSGARRVPMPDALLTNELATMWLAYLRG